MAVIKKPPTLGKTEELNQGLKAHIETYGGKPFLFLPMSKSENPKGGVLIKAPENKYGPIPSMHQSAEALLDEAIYGPNLSFTEIKKAGMKIAEENSNSLDTLKSYPPQKPPSEKGDTFVSLAMKAAAGGPNSSLPPDFQLFDTSLLKAMAIDFAALDAS